MRKNVLVQRKALYSKVRAISNQQRFRILELTQEQKMSISSLSKTLHLSYTKCADYVCLLEKHGLVRKTRVGKEMHVASSVQLKEKSVRFG